MDASDWINILIVDTVMISVKFLHFIIGKAFKNICKRSYMLIFIKKKKNFKIDI